VMPTPAFDHADAGPVTLALASRGQSDSAKT